MAKKPRTTDTISNWFHSVENFQTSPLEFYTAVEQTLRRRQIPDIRTSQVDWREGGPLSARRTYLRVRRRNLAFDICAAPFGTGFFFSWWLGELHSFLWVLATTFPILGVMVKSWLGHYSYYRLDTALMFQDGVHQAVLEVIDGMTSAKGIRALSELDRKPILRGFRR